MSRKVLPQAAGQASYRVSYFGDDFLLLASITPAWQRTGVGGRLRHPCDGGDATLVLRSRLHRLRRARDSDRCELDPGRDDMRFADRTLFDDFVW